MTKFLLVPVLACLLLGCSQPAEKSIEISQWRGPARDGIYPVTGLLKEWPEGGPELLWSFEGLGAGHGSPVVAGDFVYVTGIPDTIKSEGVLYKFDLTGNLIWQKSYGPDFSENFPGARSTPTVADDQIGRAHV